MGSRTMRSRTSTMSDSHYSGSYMRDSSLPHSLCGGHLLVLCIAPYL